MKFIFIKRAFDLKNTCTHTKKTALLFEAFLYPSEVLLIPKELWVCVCAQSLSRVQLFMILWTVAHQASLSMEFSRQECWSKLPFPIPGDLPDPGIEPTSLAAPALADGFLTAAPEAVDIFCSIWLFFKKTLPISKPFLDIFYEY